MTQPPRGILGDADRCCAALCDYRVEVVKFYLDVFLAHEQKGEDPCQRSATARYGIDSGGKGGEGETMMDVKRVVAELRAAGKPVSEASVAARLCPWALED